MEEEFEEHVLDDEPDTSVEVTEGEITTMEAEKSFVDLLAELAKTQALLVKAQVTKSMRLGKNKLDNMVKEAENLSNSYYSSKQEKQNILKQYKDVISQINDTHDTTITGIIEKIGNIEGNIDAINLELKQKKDRLPLMEKIRDEKFKQLLNELGSAVNDEQKLEEKKQELVNFNKDNPLILLNSRIEKLQAEKLENEKMLEAAKEELQQAEKEKQKELDDCSLIKTTELAKIPKQNIFQKVFSVLFRKGKNFVDFVSPKIDKIKAKIPTTQDIKKSVSEVIETVEQNRNQFITNKKQQLQKQIKDKTAELQKLQEQLNGNEQSEQNPTIDEEALEF